jgi:predicted ArsR family transcriptional regulator
VYEQQYTVEQFEAALSDTVPRTATVIAKNVGCSVNTAKFYLKQLKDAEKATEIVIEGCKTHGWLLTKLV